MRETSRPHDPDTGFSLGRVLSRLAEPDRKPTPFNGVSSRKPSLIVDNDRVPPHLPPETDVREMTRAELWPLPGFAPMTRITTSFGEVHAAALRKGDAVRTAKGEFKKIVWLDRVILDGRFLGEYPDANPIRIPADSLGRGFPRNDVLLSPRQRIGFAPRLNITGKVEAADLLQRPGVVRFPETGISYTMFHVGEPIEVNCEGVPIRIEP